MIPETSFLLDGDTALWAVDPVTRWEFVYVNHRPCDNPTCGGSGLIVESRPGWAMSARPCPACHGSTRHTFMIEVNGPIIPRLGHSDQYNAYWVHVIDVLEIVSSGHLASGYPFITPKIGGGWVEHHIPRAMAERRPITLPPAAEPGQYLVTLKVHP